jgi:acyl-CoA-binding protein
MSDADAELTQRFEQAVADSKTLSERPDNVTLLELYALFKQATEGDVKEDRPGGFDFVGGAKWDARDGLRGVSGADAMRRYIDKVQSLKG